LTTRGIARDFQRCDDAENLIPHAEGKQLAFSVRLWSRLAGTFSSRSVAIEMQESTTVEGVLA
jgi:hypothetical protein